MKACAKSVSFTLVFMAALFLVVSNVWAVEGDSRRPYMHREGKSDELINELNLTPSQQEQLKKQRGEHGQKFRDTNEQLRGKELELRQELEKDVTDKRKVDELMGEIKVLQGQRLEQRVEGTMSMKEILTPEQFRLFREKTKANFKDRRDDFKYRRKLQGEEAPAPEM